MNTLTIQKSFGGNPKKAWARMVVFCGLLALVLGGCTDDSPRAEGGKPVVVATTTMIADLARVLGGDDVEVVSIMRAGEDPHIYDVRPRDAQAVATADLVLMNGFHLESTLERVVDNNASGQVVRLAEAAGVEPLADGPGDAASGAGGAPDPHAWMSVPRWKGYVAAARDALIELDPANADAYGQRAQAYLAELDELDAWIRTQWERVPPEKRVIITSHDAFNYYADEYGVEVHGVIGLSTEQQPRPQDLQALEALVRERGIGALFIETSVSNTLNQIVRKVAQDTGAAIGGTLYSDSLGEPGTEAGTYTGMIRHNTTTMVEALQ